MVQTNFSLGFCCCSVAQSCSTLFDSTGYSMPGFPVLHHLPEFAQTHVELVMPSNHLIPCVPFSSCLPSFPVSGSFLMSWLFPSGGQSTGTSASASILLMNIQDQFPFRLTGLISLQSKSSQGPQFKSISSSAISLLYSSTLTSIHDYWKNHTLDCMDLCQQNNVSAF